MNVAMKTVPNQVCSVLGLYSIVPSIVQGGLNITSHDKMLFNLFLRSLHYCYSMSGLKDVAPYVLLLNVVELFEGEI